MMGAEGHRPYGNPSLRYVCALSAKHMQEIGETADSALVVTDRTSNGPNVYYPNPLAPGGTGASENWVLDSFSHDPYAKVAMVGTAENVARKWQISTEEQHDVVAQHYEQYCVRPPTTTFRDDTCACRGADQVSENCRDHEERRRCIRNSRDGLNKLKPVLPDGTVTFGSQTHPADGNASMIVTTREKASAISADPKIEIRLAGFGRRTRQGPHAARTCPRITTRSKMRAYRWTTSPL